MTRIASLLFSLTLLLSSSLLPQLALSSEGQLSPSDQAFFAIRSSDFDLAKKLYTQAISEGDPSGAFGLGQMYAQGWGVEKSPTKAFEAFCLSIKLAKGINDDNAVQIYTLFSDSYAAEHSLTQTDCLSE